MKVPYSASLKTNASSRGMSYVQGASSNLAPITAGINAVADSFSKQNAQQNNEKERLNRFKAINSFSDYETNSLLALDEEQKNAALDDNTFHSRITTKHENYTKEFIATLPSDLQEEFTSRSAEVRQKITLKSKAIQDENNSKYYANSVDEANKKAAFAVDKDQTSLEAEKARIEELINTSNWSEDRKIVARKLNAASLEGIAYKKEVTSSAKKTGSLVSSVVRESAKYGFNPEDVLTAMSYETGGKLKTEVRGGKDNLYVGLIQFGPEEQRKYGVYQGQPVEEQVAASIKFLHDRGYRATMPFIDMYSTINAGSPGHYNASDSPGNTVASHVAGMDDHRKRAKSLLMGEGVITDDADNNPRYANLPLEDRINLRKAAEVETRKEMSYEEQAASRESATFTNQLMNGLLDGTKTRNDIDEAYALGKLVDYNDRQRAYAVVADQEEKAQLTATTQLKLSGGALWDSSDAGDKKMANNWLGTEGIKAITNLDENYVQDSLLPFVNKTNMLPPQAVSNFESMIKSSNPKQQLFALNSLSLLETQSPEVYVSQVPSRVQTLVDKWHVLKNVGDDKMIFNSLRGGDSIEIRNARKTLEMQVDDVLEKPTNPNHVTFQTVLDAFTVDRLGPFNDVPVSPAVANQAFAMQTEWKALLKENYVQLNGNMEKAQEMTIKQLDRFWGTTNVGGRFTLMRHPPEKIGLPKISGSYDWIDQQAREENKIELGNNFELLADDQTRKEYATGKPVSYQIFVEKDGVMELVRNENNRPRRQTFKPTPEMINKDKLDFELQNIKKEIRRLDSMIFFKGQYRNVGVKPIQTDWENQKEELVRQRDVLEPAARRPAWPRLQQ